jgi:hypothetical protein
MLQTDFTSLQQDLASLQGKHQLLTQQHTSLLQQVEGLGKMLDLATKGVTVLREIGQQARARVNEVVDPLAREGLSEIFGPDCTFETVFRQLPAGKWSARVVTGVGDQKGNPVATDGGSVSEVVSDAILRPLVLCLSRGNGSRLIALDEPWSGVDAHNAEALFGFVRRLGEEFGIQWVIATHIPPDVIGNNATVIDVTQVSNVTKEDDDL